MILELLQKDEQQWQIFKERLVYQYEVEQGQGRIASAQVKKGRLEDVEALTEMTLAFDIDEYPDKSNREEDKAFGQILHGIENNGLFVVKSKGQVCCMLQVIETEDFNKPNLLTKAKGGFSSAGLA